MQIQVCVFLLLPLLPHAAMSFRGFVHDPVHLSSNSSAPAVASRDLSNHSRLYCSSGYGECLEYTGIEDDVAEDFPWQYNVTEFKNYNLQWKRTASSAKAARKGGGAAANNLCIDGKLVPRFYLIGAQKSATSSFASELNRWTTNVVLPEMTSWSNSERLLFSKELHFFDAPRRWNKGKQFWLNHWPKCPATHMLAADFTPSYLSTWEAPLRLQQTYGQQGTALTFLVILREPIARMQSSFYHGIASGWVSPEFKTFQQYVDIALSKFNHKQYRKFHDCQPKPNQGMGFVGSSGVPFSLSLYLDQIKNWLAHFNPEQFLVVPMKAYVDPQPGNKYGRLVEFVVKWHGLNMKAPAQRVKVKEPPRLNVHKHPEVAQDLKPDTYIRLKQIFNVATGPHKLAALLSYNMQKGLILFGYPGAATNKGWIAHYLEQNW
jgi:hypothetical protein